MTAQSKHTQIGIIGTNKTGVRLARLFAGLGHRVVLGSRSKGRARALPAALCSPHIRGGSYGEAARCQIVLPAVSLGEGLLTALEPLRRRLSGKILIDITNPFIESLDEMSLPWDSSSAEQLQARFPKSRIVGAFKNVWWDALDGPPRDGPISDVYVVADDAQAKLEFLAAVKGSPFRYLDAGPLKNARTVERMTLLIGELGQRYGYFPRLNWRVAVDPAAEAGESERPRSLFALAS